MAKNVYAGNSRLCSSYAWDTALKFIELQNAEYLSNSKNSWYNKSEPTLTGYDDHPCNIYDMGGNVIEVTTEVCSDKVNFDVYPDGNYVGRGGSYSYTSDDCPAVTRGNLEWSFPSDRNGSYLGFRITYFM